MLGNLNNCSDNQANQRWNVLAVVDIKNQMVRPRTEAEYLGIYSASCIHHEQAETRAGALGLSPRRK